MFPVFKRHEIFGLKKQIPRVRTAFPRPLPFSLKSTTFSGLENAFSNSMTFHDFQDRVNPVQRQTTHTSSLFHPFLLKITLIFSLYNNAGGAGNPK